MKKFVDQAKIQVQGGHGGAGAISFRREKYEPNGGPDGGDGGDGGDIILKTSLKVQSLMDLKLKKSYKAQAGQPGQGKKKFGSRGKDIILSVPVGTLVYDESQTLIQDLCETDTELVIAKGGKGGKGNAQFATSRNQTPYHAQTGLPGEALGLSFELRLIAEVGLIGLPNAGKSTMLKALTQASPKIGDYPFTTLYPNLGTLKFVDQEIILADIPGIIEGASEGHGLGSDFLRHIDRTKILIHLVSVEGPIEELHEQLKIIENELTKSDYNLLEKKRFIVLSKIDMIHEDDLKLIMKSFKHKNIEVLGVSSISKKGMDTLINTIREAVIT